jgi:precorrin-4/cobalt-precorrin-4 C11-methyltransferase
MTIHFVGAGPGAADLITIRGRDIIRRCRVCLYAGSVISSDLLTHCDANTRLVDTAKLSLDQITTEYKRAHAQGFDVARLHSGDLSIWSAIAEQIRQLEALHIPYTVTPGVPSYAAAAATLAQELTLPGVTQSVVLARLGGRATAVPPNESLERFAVTGATLAIHLSVHRLNDVVRQLSPHYGVDCPIAVVYHASWPDERIIRGTLGTIIDSVSADPIDRTAIILVGRVLGNESFKNSSVYDAVYSRRFRFDQD